MKDLTPNKKNETRWSGLVIGVTQRGLVMSLICSRWTRAAASRLGSSRTWIQNKTQRGDEALISMYSHFNWFLGLTRASRLVWSRAWKRTCAQLVWCELYDMRNETIHQRRGGGLSRRGGLIVRGEARRWASSPTRTSTREEEVHRWLQDTSKRKLADFFDFFRFLDFVRAPPSSLPGFTRG